MEQPESYNIMHVGPELDVADAALLRQARKNKVVTSAVFLSIGMMFLSFLLVNASVHSTLEENKGQISSLIDEVGLLNQQNFELSQQLLTQDSVLQGIEGDFTKLGEAIESGNSNELKDVFSGILSRFEETGESVSLSAEAETVLTEDQTFDVLILGTNGSLTDTIMVASVNKEKKKITLFSIPRDLYINGRRINAYYSYYGVDQLEKQVTEVTGLTMDRYVQIDLAGFVSVVDILGGLDIYVDDAIYDGLYPNGNGGYSAYSIEVGQHHLDGAEALKYARSRESTSDFDRAERQQKILAALRTKLVQLDSVMEMKQLTQLFVTALENTKTDMDIIDIVGYYYDYQGYDLSTGFVLTSGNYLYSMINQSGAYILLPREGNFSQIHDVISQLVN